MADGLRLFGNLGGSGPWATWLLDKNNNVVHTWSHPASPGAATYLQPDGLLLRTTRTDTPSDPVLMTFGGGGVVQRIDLDGNIVWDYRVDSLGKLQHHDVEYMPNGNVLILAWEERPLANAISAGRDPATLEPGLWRPDCIIEVEPTGPTTGNIVWEWSVMDHVIQDHDPTKANFGIVGDHPELIDINYPPQIDTANDWNHCNNIDYDPVNDLIIISARGQHELWVIDHSTTSIEAAGHTGGVRGKGGDILYRWGNPEAYRAGTPADQQLFGQHSVKVVPEGYPGAGNYILFNNNHPGGSAAWEIVPPQNVSGDFILDPSGVYGPAAPVWSFQNSLLFGSGFISGVDRLRNGNTLICSGAQGLLLEVTNAGALVWTHQEPAGTLIFHAHNHEQYLWCDTTEMSIQNGGMATFDLIAGSDHANEAFLVLGSVTGTSPGFSVGGIHVPLEADGYLTTTMSVPNLFPFGNTSGILDGDGRAQATFTLPPAVIPPAAIGIEFHHAFVTFDGVTGNVNLASNAVTFTLID